MSFRLVRRKLRPLEWIQKCWMHFYCFLVKEITKWAEIFTGWFYYISLDSCKVWKHLQTLYQCCAWALRRLFIGKERFLPYLADKHSSDLFMKNKRRKRSHFMTYRVINSELLSLSKLLSNNSDGKCFVRNGFFESSFLVKYQCGFIGYSCFKLTKVGFSPATSCHYLNTNIVFFW